MAITGLEPLESLNQPCPLTIKPRNATEQAVANAFEEVLGISNVGAYDHFFELGGDSLAALNLLDKLNAHFGFELSAEALLHHLTVALLAEMIPIWRSHAEGINTFAPSKSPLERQLIVTLKTGGAKAPLFILPGGHGSENELIVFARMLSLSDLDRPIYGLRISALVEQFNSMQSLSELATEIVEFICKTQVVGPWNLMGECISGQLAIEVARQLQARDPQRLPERIILLDSRTNEYIGQHKMKNPSKAGTIVQSHLSDFFRLHLEWEPVAVDFPIHIITSDTFASQGDDSSLGWQKHCSLPVSVSHIAESHAAYIRKGSAKTAQRIKQILESH